jgi:hypothetical protein
MFKHIASVGGIGLAAAFVVVFFIGRTDSKHLTEVAPRVGMTYEDLMAMGPRIASQTGVTLGTSRHVVYLLACSGLATKSSLEVQATKAGNLARQQRLSDREAVVAVLEQNGNSTTQESLKGC